MGQLPDTESECCHSDEHDTMKPLTSKKTKDSTSAIDYETRLRWREWFKQLDRELDSNLTIFLRIYGTIRPDNERAG